MNEYKHYIRTDEAGTIVYGFSDAFEQPRIGDMMISENAPRHFQESFPESLVNERGQFLFKWVGEIVKRTNAELETEWTSRPPSPPTIEERLEAAEAALLAMMEAIS